MIDDGSEAGADAAESTRSMSARERRILAVAPNYVVD